MYEKPVRILQHVEGKKEQVQNVKLLIYAINEGFTAAIGSKHIPLRESITQIHDHHRSPPMSLPNSNPLILQHTASCSILKLILLLYVLHPPKTVAAD